MKLQYKILILLILVTGVIFFSFLLYLGIEFKKKNLFENEAQKNNALVIDQILKIQKQKVDKLTMDYSGYDEMVTFIKKKNTAWAKENVDILIPVYNISFVLIFNTSQKLVYSVYDSTESKKPYLIDRNIISAKLAHSPFCHYFQFFDNHLYEIFGATVVPAADMIARKTPTQGFLILAKRIDKDYLKELALITSFDVEIAPLSDSNQLSNSDNPSKFYQRRTLNNSENKVIAQFIFSKSNTLKQELKSFTNISILLGFVSILIIIFFLFRFRKLVLLPLTKISQTLDTGETAHINSLLAGSGEFKKLAGLMLDFVNQKNMLEDYNVDLKNKNNEILTQNEMLNQQKEELQAQSDNLEQAFLEIQEQKKSIERSHADITSSINYAHRIQHALLPQAENFKIYFPQHFIFYRPRNIVSGDFYWTKMYKNIIILVVADCTGHGVPGAFMSLLGMAFLNEIFLNLTQLDSKKIQANEILNLLRSHIITVLHQTENFQSNSDGMDAAICIFDIESREMQFAGANMPVIIFQNNLLTEIKPDKMPIGIHPRASNSFTNKSIILSDNANIYLFSDGIVDQYSIEKKRKYYRKNFRKFLTDIQILPVEFQGDAVNNEFLCWKKDSSQTDDILVIGIKTIF